MPTSREEVVARIRAADIAKVLRYGAVSAVAFPLTQIMIFICSSVLGWSGVVSNAVAVTVAAVPAYILNRYWVWGKRDKNRFASEILPFWILTLIGLALSSFFAYYADRWFESPLAINVANAVGFGIVWVFKFLVLDRVMFGSHQHFPVDERLEAELAESSAGV